MSEGVELQITQVNSTRMLLNVRKGKGAKERYYGFFSPGNRQRLHLARKQLNICNSAKVADINETNAASAAQDLRCLKCGRAMEMIHIHRPNRCRPPRDSTDLSDLPNSVTLEFQM